MGYRQLIFLSLLALPSVISARTFEVSISGGVTNEGTVEVEEGTGVAALLNMRGGVYAAGCPRGILYCCDEDGFVSNEEGAFVRINVYQIVEEDLEDVPIPEGYRLLVPEHMLPCVDSEDFNQRLADYIERRSEQP